MKKLIALLLALVMVLGLVACTGGTEGEGGATAADGAKKTIYVLTPSPDHGWTGAIGVAAKEKVEALNAEGKYEVILQTFEKADDQTKLIEDIIAKEHEEGTVGVAMLPAGNDVEDAIQQLIDAGIPYTAADRIIPAVAPKAVSNVKYDNIEIGAAAASWLVANGLKEGDYVAVIEGDGSSADTDRTKGFNDYLLGKVEYAGKKIETPWASLDTVAYSGPTGWNPANAQAWFESYGKIAETKFIASWDDGLTCGIFDALEGTAIDAETKAAFLEGKPFITGCGGAQALYDIIAGTSDAYTCTASFGGVMSVTYPPAMIQVTIQALVDYFDGKTVPQDNTQSAECVTKDNVANYKGFA
ncbi:MAG: substrate-binding domain-containing protein [Oscillospiraceae bacterium]|nr:substrate-binding domain-containing protein [Oscillospiraceae bacterium]